MRSAEPGAVRAPAERLEHPGLDVDRDDPAGGTDEPRENRA